MIEITEKIKGQLLLVAIVIIVILLVSRGCGNVEIGSGTGDVIKRDTTIVTKEVIIHTTDTIAIYISVPERDVPLLTNLMDLSDTSVFHNTEPTKYHYGAKDSLLSYNIYIESTVKPSNVSMKYDVAQFTIKDSTLIVRDTVKTITNKVRVNQVYVGGSAVVYPSFNAVFFGVDFVSKKGWQFEGAVGIIDNSPGVSVGFKKLISFRKK